jgi:hypothetical protein
MTATRFRGDLSTLNLAGVFRALGRTVEQAEGESGKYWARCPWADEHSGTGRKDTVLWQESGKWPGFFCAHNHCTGRNLEAVLEWAESQRPGIIDGFCSCEWGKQQTEPKRAKKGFREHPLATPPAVIARGAEAVENAERFLKGFRVDEADLWRASQIYPGENWQEDSTLFLEHLYLPGEFVCICTDFDVQTKRDGSQKAVPKGSGQTRTVRDWVERINRAGSPGGAAGAWIRFNPVSETGSGQTGAHRDSDVTSHRYLLVESDELPIEIQLSLYARLMLGVAALVTSGGKSVHAVARIDAESEADFKAGAAHVLRRLTPFGVDPSNRNPSRYGRLPGVLRSIGATGDGQQRLLYLNPQPKGGSIF